MPYSETDTDSSSPCCGKKEHIVSECVSLMTETVMSYNSGTSASMGNPISCAQADGSGNMSSVLIG